MDIQGLVDAINEACQDERKKYYLKLGDLIKVLEENPDCLIEIGGPHSYRGYYCDLSFERGEPIKASELLEELKSNVLNKELEGYKGGEFLMSEDVPCWVAYYGSCGEALIGAKPINGKIALHTKKVD